jgi:hypothetical protein
MIEATVSRLYGHSSSSGAARVKDEPDPISLFEEKLLDARVIDRDEIEYVYADAQAEIEAAIEQVLSEPPPTPADIERHTYAPSEVDVVYPVDYCGLPSTVVRAGIPSAVAPTVLPTAVDRSVFLNVWFPGHLPDTEGRTRLPLGIPATLRVDFGQPLSQRAVDASVAIRPETVPSGDSQLVEVFVYCRAARVTPYRRELTLLSAADQHASYEITPHAAGEQVLTVVISALNEPLHEASFTFEAYSSPQTRSAAVPLSVQP